MNLYRLNDSKDRRNNYGEEGGRGHAEGQPYRPGSICTDSARGLRAAVISSFIEKNIGLLQLSKSWWNPNAFMLDLCLLTFYTMGNDEASCRRGVLSPYGHIHST